MNVFTHFGTAFSRIMYSDNDNQLMSAREKKLVAIIALLHIEIPATEMKK